MLHDNPGARVETKGYMQFLQRDRVCTFKGNAELWSSFKTECKLRGVSICHVLEALMQAWIEGQRATATVIKPVTVNLTMQHIVKRPRRIQQLGFQGPWYWPPNCKHADKWFKGENIIGCKLRKNFVKMADCWSCFVNYAP